MPTTEELANALDTALATARAEYRSAVLELATSEAAIGVASDREPANVDHIHRARTRVIALDHAREELTLMIDEGASLSRNA